MALDKELMDFLLNGSQTALKSAFLKHLSEYRNRRKEISESLDALIEENALLIVTEWFIAHGSELAGKLGERQGPDLPLVSQPFALPRAFNKPRTWQKPRRRRVN